MQVSEITKFLEQAYDALNIEFFEGELPKAVITVQSTPKAYGHFTPFDAWKENNNGYKEINLGAENLNRPICCTIATLIHEMCHFYCQINGIKDVSRGGTYHNKRFKEEAEKRGLLIGYDPRIGFSITEPSPELIAFVTAQGWQGTNLARTGAANYGTDGGAGGGEDKGAGGIDGVAGKKNLPQENINALCADAASEQPKRYILDALIATPKWRYKSKIENTLSKRNSI